MGREGRGGREGSGSAPQVKAWPPPITIFLAPVLVFCCTVQLFIHSLSLLCYLFVCLFVVQLFKTVENLNNVTDKLESI